mgnify:CR=1 FL=1
MNLKYSFVIIILFFSTISKGQQYKSDSYREGLYYGGKYFANIQSGYYYFKKDSTFLFLGLTEKKNINLKDTDNPKRFFTDSIQCFGKGRWYLKDSFYIMEFEDIRGFYTDIKKDDIQYHSYSKFPYDSLFLKFHVLNYTPQTKGVASVTFKEINVGNITDTLGFSESVAPLSFIKYELSIFKPGFEEKTIKLIQNNNAHEIVINLSPESDSKIYLVGSIKIPYLAYSKKNNKRVQFWNDKRIFTAEQGDIKKLIEIVRKSYSNTSEQKYLLDLIISELMQLSN